LFLCEGFFAWLTEGQGLVRRLPVAAACLLAWGTPCWLWPRRLAARGGGLWAARCCPGARPHRLLRGKAALLRLLSPLRSSQSLARDPVAARALRGPAWEPRRPTGAQSSRRCVRARDIFADRGFDSAKGQALFRKRADVCPILTVHMADPTAGSRWRRGHPPWPRYSPGFVR
jgi:hypothetical protein